MRILTIPGVFHPDDDSTLLLAEALSGENLKRGAAVLDMCTGSGVLSIVAARLGAGTVTAVDVSRLAVICTRLNAVHHRAPVCTRLGDLFAAVGEGALFDAIVSNPPFLPSETDELPTGGLARARSAGRDGRALIDRVCAEAPTHLRPGGFLLLVHSSVCDVQSTVELLTARGLNVNIVARRVAPWTDPYELVVIRASRHLPNVRTAPKSGSDGV